MTGLNTKEHHIIEIATIITDENLKGKIRVSIVATALDGYKKGNTIINVVNRFSQKNTEKTDNLFTRTTSFENNTLNSINGATALKLDEEVETDQHKQILDQETNIEKSTDVLPEGVSIESASYIENNAINNFNTSNEVENLVHNQIVDKEDDTPRLFNEMKSSKEIIDQDEDNRENKENLFDAEDNSEDDEFEIPAFLRKQKF